MAKGEMLQIPLEAGQMTQRDIDRIKVLHNAIQKRITQAKASELLGLSREWVNQLCQRIRKKGDRAIIHGLRGAVVLLIRIYFSPYHMYIGSHTQVSFRWFWGKFQCF